MNISYCPSPFPSTVPISRQQIDTQRRERQRRYEGIHQPPIAVEASHRAEAGSQVTPGLTVATSVESDLIDLGHMHQESTFPETFMLEHRPERPERQVQAVPCLPASGQKRRASPLDSPPRDPRLRVLEGEFGADIRPSDQSSPKYARNRYVEEPTFLGGNSSASRIVGRRPTFYERGNLLLPRDGQGGRLPPLYKEGPRLTEAKRVSFWPSSPSLFTADELFSQLTNRHHRSRGSVFIRLEGQNACDHCQEDAISGWEAKDHDYIGCWVKVSLSWTNGDLAPTFVVGGCGECRSVGRGSRKGVSGCSLNGKRDQKAAKSTAVGSTISSTSRHPAVSPDVQVQRRISPPPSPLYHCDRNRTFPPVDQAQTTSNLHVHAPDRHTVDRIPIPREPSSSSREALATAKCLTKFCAARPADEDAHVSLRRAVKEIVLKGWQAQAEKEIDWWPFACRYLKDWRLGIRGTEGLGRSG